MVYQSPESKKNLIAIEQKVEPMQIPYLFVASPAS